MKSIARLTLAALAAASLGASGAAQAQRYSFEAYPSPHFYLGGSVGAANYGDNTGTTAGWLANAYTSSTNLAAGDYITSVGSQDSSSFGGKVYGGAWFTPYLGVELGYVSLGSIHYSVDSFNSTGSFSVNDSGHVRPSLWYESVLLGVDYGGLKAYGKAGAYQASLDISDNTFDLVGGGYYPYSDTLHNTGAVLGLGLQSQTGYHGAWRLELEDYLNVGPSTSNTVPPWRGNILLLSAGYSFLF